MKKNMLLKQTVLLTIIAFITLITFLDVNRRMINAYQKDLIATYSDSRLSETDIAENPFLTPFHFDLGDLFKNALPVLLLGIAYYFSSRYVKHSLPQLILAFLGGVLLIWLTHVLFHFRFDAVREISWLFYVIAITSVRKSNYYMGIILSTIWINHWFFLDTDNLANFSELFLGDQTLFTRWMDYVPTLFACIMVGGWVLVVKKGRNGEL